LLSAGIGGCFGSGQAQEEAPWLEFEWPEADLLFQGDPFWVGGDGAYSIDLGDGRVLWLFGDSWIDPGGGGSRENATMVSNSLALQRGYDPSRAAIEFFWEKMPEGQAGAFFPDFHGGRYWPGHGLRVGDRLLVFLMEVRPGDGLGFEVADWEVVLVANPDRDPSDWEFEWLETPPNPYRIIVGSGTSLARDGHVYAFGSREEDPGRHDVYLVRWREEEVLRGALEGMEWWGGSDRGWLPDAYAGTPPQPVFSGGQTEFTVHYDDDSGSFVEYQTVGFGAAAVTRRTAPALTGPWSEPDTVFVPAQAVFPRIMIYQGKAHPQLEGADLVVTYCTNSFDFGDHLAEHWLYYPRFVRVNDP
jgi:hypothetical protein